MEKLESEHLTVKNGFLRLKQDIASFRTDLEDVKKAEKIVAAHIIEINKQITQLEKDLEV